MTTIMTEPTVEATQQCTSCKMIKPVSRFSVAADSRTGRQRWCKGCFKKYRESKKALDKTVANLSPDSKAYIARLRSPDPEVQKQVRAETKVRNARLAKSSGQFWKALDVELERERVVAQFVSKAMQAMATRRREEAERSLSKALGSLADANQAKADAQTELYIAQRLMQEAEAEALDLEKRMDVVWRNYEEAMAQIRAVEVQRKAALIVRAE